jgi:hypothetical protein
VSDGPTKSDAAMLKRVTDELWKRIDEIREAIQTMHKCTAKYVESVDVVEKFEGKTVWDGVVEVFDLSGHAQASRCYAWTFKEDGQQRYVTVLELPPVTSPATAVQAAIASGQQK